MYHGRQHTTSSRRKKQTDDVGAKEESELIQRGLAENGSENPLYENDSIVREDLTPYHCE